MKTVAQDMLCLWHVAQGGSVKEIALKLGLSRRTVSGYLQRAKARMGANNMPQAVYKAVYYGAFFAVGRVRFLLLPEEMATIVYKVIEGLLSNAELTERQEFKTVFGDIPHDWKAYFIKLDELE